MRVFLQISMLGLLTSFQVNICLWTKNGAAGLCEIGMFELEFRWISVFCLFVFVFSPNIDVVG